METLALFVILPALVVGLFAILFGLGRVLSPQGLRRIGHGLRPAQFNLWQMMIGVALFALVLLAFEGGHGTMLVITLVSLFVLAWFIRNWRGEFVFLMGLREDDLPGRHDKLIWAVVLLAFAPIGVWFFRAYRLAHWPEPEPATDPERQTGEAGQAATQPA